MEYLESNRAYWQKGYFAPNVESFLFRPYGRILKPKFGLTGAGQSVLDWGCGQGAALGFFRRLGFETYGVDISEADIDVAKIHAHHVKVVDSAPPAEPYFPGVQYDLVTSVQSFYYLNDTDMEICLQSLKEQMKQGAVIYATMMGTQCYFHNHSKPADNGMRVVNFKTPRLDVKDYHVNFTESRDDLIKKFHMFAPKHIGYYDACWLEDEGSEFHYTFIGQKA